MGPDAAFGAFLEAGRFRLQHCGACTKSVFPPRAICAHCGADALEFRDAIGTGTVYSTTVIRSSKEPPYNVALIDLDEGARMMSRVEGLAPEAVRIGMRVRARIAGAPALVVFDPA